MTEQLQLRRGTASQVAAFTGAQGELVVDTTNNRAVVNDGATAGGWPAAKLVEVVTNTRVAVSDAAYVALSTDRLIAFTALTAARAVTLCAASSLTIPPLPTAARPASNCGFTSTTIRGQPEAARITAGSTSVAEMKETSIAMKSIGVGMRFSASGLQLRFGV